MYANYLPIAVVLLLCGLNTAMAQADRCGSVNLCLLVDGSGSICDNKNVDTCDNWERVKNYTRAVIATYRISQNGSHVCIITFGSEAKVIHNLTSNRNVTLGRYPGGRTDMYGALIEVQKIFSRTNDNRANVIFLISDGHPNVPHNTTTAEILVREQALKIRRYTGSATIEVVTVAVGDQNVTLLRQFSDNAKNHLTVTDFDQLADRAPDTCFTIPQPNDRTDCMTTPLDICFLIDGSGTICGENAPLGGCDNWQNIQMFLHGLIDSFDVSPDKVNVGGLVFSNEADVVFNLTLCSGNQAQARTCIQRMFYPGGRRFTAAGLEAARMECFGSGRHRNEANNVLFLLTVGNPNQPVGTARTQAIREAELLHEQFVDVYVAGITNDVDKGLLRDLASDPKQENRNYFVVPHYRELINKVSEISDQICKAGCRSQADVCVIVDSSGSIGQDNYDSVKQFVNDFLGKMANGRTRVAVVYFSGNAYLYCQLGGEAACRNKMRNMPYLSGVTNTSSAIELCAQQVFGSSADRQSVPNFAVIITDGGSNNKTATIMAATKARPVMEIFAVGVGSWVDDFEMKAITSHPYDNHVLNLINFDALPTLVGRLKSIACNDDNDCKGNVCRNNGKCLDKTDSYLCQCPVPYGGPNCTYACRIPGDVIFSLDASGSIHRERFVQMVDFAKSVAQCLPLGNGMEGGKVGLLTFSDNYHRIFHLNEHDTLTDILDAMTLSEYLGESTGTASAIAYVRTMFSTENGGREDRPHVHIIVTDGGLNDYNETWRESERNRLAGIETLVVAVTSGTRRDMEIRPMASRDSNIFKVDSFGDLMTKTGDVCDAMCNVVDQCDPNPCGNGGTCRDLIGGYECTCRPDYSGRTCDRACPGTMDLAVVLDCSSRIHHNRFDDIKNMIVQIISQHQISNRQTRVALVTFSDTARVAFCFDEFSDFTDVAIAILGQKYCGNSPNISNALNTARQELFTARCGDRQGARNQLILYSAGEFIERMPASVKSAVQLKIRGIRITTLSIGSNVNLNEMTNLVSKPRDENVIQVNSYSQMSSMIPRAVRASCNDEDDCDGVRCDNGGTCVDGYHSFTCTDCTQLYTGPRCERQCRRSADLVLILDSSGSIENVCNIGLEFFRLVVMGLETRRGVVRVAFIDYNTDAQVVFRLNEYTDKQDMLTALSCMRQGGRTNTSEALRLARTQVLTRDAGDRLSVDNVVIIATDGGDINPSQTIRMATNLKRPRPPNYGGAEIFVAAVGNVVDMEEVDQIATEGDPSHVEAIPTAAGVNQAATNILDQICQ